MNIAIVRAGTAGCFAAIEIKRRHPEAVVTVYESGHKALAKVGMLRLTRWWLLPGAAPNSAD